MEEIVVKFDVPSELNEEFRLALAKVVKQFVRRLQFSIAENILSESELTDKQVSELSDDLKERVAKRHSL